MAKQLFESDAVFPDVNTMNPSSYLQKLATIYDSDSDQLSSYAYVKLCSYDTFIVPIYASTFMFMQCFVN